jgi:hypothetical protein
MGNSLVVLRGFFFHRITPGKTARRSKVPTCAPENGPDFRTNPRSMERYERFGMADRVIAVGFWINAVLMVIKLLAGYFGHSEAVFADGMESAADFVAILASIIALKIGRRPFDHDHPMGTARRRASPPSWYRWSSSPPAAASSTRRS